MTDWQSESSHLPPGGERSARPHNSRQGQEALSRLAVLLRDSPIPLIDLPRNLPLYMNRECLGDMVTTIELYRRILHVPGEVMEFGTRWGRRLSLLVNLRELYEPHNYTRRIVGFDTFSGFPRVSEKDGDHPKIRVGSLSVAENYVAHLDAVLEAHEHESLLAHVKRFQICAGDVRQTLRAYLAAHPEALISLAYFDLDLYEPTKACLELALPRMAKGSILAFDQLSQLNFPGETRALLEVLDLSSLRLERLSFHPYPIFIRL
jgi:Macrocin-O-methyltransferase (TylF)